MWSNGTTAKQYDCAKCYNATMVQWYNEAFVNNVHGTKVRRWNNVTINKAEGKEEGRAASKSPN